MHDRLISDSVGHVAIGAMGHAAVVIRPGAPGIINIRPASAIMTRRYLQRACRCSRTRHPEGTCRNLVAQFGDFMQLRRGTKQEIHVVMNRILPQFFFIISTEALSGRAGTQFPGVSPYVPGGDAGEPWRDTGDPAPGRPPRLTPKFWKRARKTHDALRRLRIRPGPGFGLGGGANGRGGGRGGFRGTVRP